MKLLIMHIGLWVILVTILPVMSYAQIPQTISYQGYLEDANGAVDRTVQMTFRIYDAETALVGDQVWMEMHTSVQVYAGVYSVVLGSAGSPLSLAFNTRYWLGVQVDSDSEMTPRQVLTSVASALNADRLDGIDSSMFLDKPTYDADNNGLVDSAETADTALTATTAGDADTVDGAHATDLLDKATYDANTDGKVDSAETADIATIATTAGDADTVDGKHAADLMDKAVYDSDANGIVDSAKNADTVDGLDASTITSADEALQGGIDAMENYLSGFLSHKWSGSSLLEETTDVSLSPESALDGSGNAIVVWQQGSASIQYLYAKHYSASSGWNTAELISDGTHDVSDQKIEFDNKGNAFVVWAQADATVANIYARRYVTGIGWGTIEQVSDGLNNASAPEIAFDHNRNAIVVWQQEGAAGQHIFAKRYDKVTGWGTIEQIDNAAMSDSFFPKIAFDLHRNAITVWRQLNNSTNVDNIYANRYVTGVGWGTPDLIDNHDISDAREPEIAMDEIGNSMVIWIQPDEVAGVDSLYASFYIADGSWGTPVLLETLNEPVDSADIAMNECAYASAVWSQSDGTVRNIYASRYDILLGWGTPELIENNSGDATFPQVTFENIDNAIAVWQQIDMGDWSVYLNRFVAGTGWGIPELLENNPGTSAMAQIEVDSRGNAFTAWHQDSGTGNNAWINMHVNSLAADVAALRAEDKSIKTTFDADSDGKVDSAESADTAVTATTAGDADTVDGAHAADLLDKATYDLNTDGKVDSAESADTAVTATTAGDADTVDGAHAADLLDKATYDLNTDGKVDSAESADTAVTATTAGDADTVDGAHAADLLDKATYDLNTDGKVDSAESADTAVTATTAGDADTVDGAHAADLLDKATYDLNTDGKVDSAESADTAVTATTAGDADTVDGAHAADLLDKATYDLNTDGKVDSAESADTAVTATTAGDADTVDGAHAADLLDKATYDLNTDGKVDSAESADTAVTATTAGDADTVDGVHADQFQRLITGTCPPDQGIRIVNSDGSVVCSNNFYSKAEVDVLINDLQMQINNLALSWATPEIIETNNILAKGPQIAIDGSGNAIAVWVEVDASYIWSIHSNRYVAGSGWESPSLIETVNPTYESAVVEIAMNESGSAFIVWRLENAAGNNIWAKRYVAGSGWEPGELIETSVYTAGGSQIAIDSSGNAVAVWIQGDGVTLKNVWANRYTVGSGWGTAELIESNAGDADIPQIAIDGNGNAIVVWYQHDGTWNNVWANRYVIGSGWATAELIETGITGDAMFPQIDMDMSGNAIVVWYQHDGTWNNVWANRYITGSGWSTAELIETENAGDAVFPQIDMDMSGNAVVVWYQNDGAGNNVWANRYITGSGWSTAELIETSDDNAAESRVALDGSGNAIAVWLQNDTTRDNVWANRYVAGSGWRRAEMIESNFGNAQSPRIVMNAGGSAIAVWMQHDGTKDDIWANSFGN